MNIRRNEIRTGLFVVITMAVIVGAILYLGAPGVFVPMNTYWVYAENAGGLKVGDDVMLAGRQVGQVVKLYSPITESSRPVVKGKQLEVLIEVRIPRSASIYKDVHVYITQYGLLGPMVMDMAGGSEASGIAENGAYFIGEQTPGLDQAARNIDANLKPVLEKAKETLDSFQKTAESLTKLTAPEGEVNKAMSEFRKLGTQLNELTSDTGPLRLSLQNLQTFTAADGKLAETMANIQEMTDKDSALARTLKNAEEFTAKLNSNKDFNITLRNFRRASAGLNAAVGDLRPQVSNIAHNLEQATDTVKRQPWRLIWPTTKKYPEDQLKATPAPWFRRVSATPVPVLRTPLPRATPAKRIEDVKQVKPVKAER